MINSGLRQLKKETYAYCQRLTEEHIVAVKLELELIQRAMADDTKSSAGDKFETSRELMKQEMDKNASKMAQLVKQRNLLAAINIHQHRVTVQTGCLVSTSQGYFFIACGLGVVQVNRQVVVVISPLSPIGNYLINRKTGDKFIFNAREYRILQII